MANENLLFRKGTLSELLSSTPIEGSINFTTDEPAIYLDVAVDGVVEHKRIGDIVQFEYLSDFIKFRDDHDKNIPQSALYYIQKDKNVNNEDIIVNALLKWNGESYLQLNEKSDYSGSLDALDTKVQALEADVENLKTASDNQDERLISIEELLGITPEQPGEGETPEQPGEGETSPTLIERIEELEKIVTDGESGVAANTTKIEELNNKITGLEGTVDSKASQSEVDAINIILNGEEDGDPQGLVKDVAAIQGIIGNDSEGLVKDVADHTTAIGAINTILNGDGTADGSQGLVKDVADLDERLQTAEGTLENLPKELNATINEKINAANAMNYIGTLAPNEDGSVVWPTENVRAGDTYVASSDFYDTALGEKQVYAGDLLIASGEEDEDGVIAGPITWNVVNTGYQAAHDQFLSADQNKIVLSSHSNETTSVEIAGSNNINVTTDTENNKIIINMVWGTFGQ